MNFRKYKIFLNIIDIIAYFLRSVNWLDPHKFDMIYLWITHKLQKIVTINNISYEK